MTPNEALEQVRALAESWRFKGRGAPDDTPDQFDEYADQLAHEILVILDAVTPEAAPSAVETVHPSDEDWERTSDDYREAGWEGSPDDYERMFFEAGFRMGRDRAATVLAPAATERTEQERDGLEWEDSWESFAAQSPNACGPEIFEAGYRAGEILRRTPPPTEQEREAAVERVMRAYFAHYGWPDGTAPDEVVEQGMRDKTTFYYRHLERAVHAMIAAYEGLEVER